MFVVVRSVVYLPDSVMFLSQYLCYRNGVVVFCFVCFVSFVFCWVFFFGFLGVGDGGVFVVVVVKYMFCMFIIYNNLD